MTKATAAEGDDVRRLQNWLLSRGGILVVGTDSLACGNWRVPYDVIDEAVLFRVRHMFIPGYVLRIKTRDTTYQFGLNWGRFWSRELPFPVRRERARLGFSWYSLAVRVALLGVFASMLWLRGR